MCGIVAYIGNQQAAPIIIKGLKRLEYRGYDSAGISLLNGGLNVYKKMGKVSELEGLLKNKSLESTIGIGHTRWATHGEPNDINAHPHKSNSGSISLIHNGIIENYASIKQELMNKGYEFESETDTEVLVNFIESIQKERDCSLARAVRIALNSVVGAYAIVVMSEGNNNQLIAARKGSPLVVGIGKGEFFFASDATPIIEYTNEVVYLNDLEIAIIENGKLTITDLKDVEKTPYVQTIKLELEAIEKGGYDHFMLKEIYEQPKSIKDCMRGRLNAAENRLVIGGIREYANKLTNSERIVIIACGTS
ncbi:MAG: isomerizing glutamine--fructose-6-phosphate transaminase, partial [Cyclobacteriaceae bacterium]|nr:isomerizing glutamine--fructose-6-phosphate transaminase [Cyclobacteriaceae bacterium]